MAERELNFRQDLKIDPDNLIEEWNNQAELYFDYDKLKAQKENERDLLQAKIDRLDRNIRIRRCELDIEIKTSDPVDYDLVKFTDSSVRSLVLSQDEIKTMYDEYYNLKEELAEISYQAKVSSSGSWSMIHRKDALQNISNLYIRDYYSTTVGTTGDIDKQIEGLKKTKKGK